jgi:hypothetical protein
LAMMILETGQGNLTENLPSKRQMSRKQAHFTAAAATEPRLQQLPEKLLVLHEVERNW